MFIHVFTPKKPPSIAGELKCQPWDRKALDSIGWITPPPDTSSAAHLCATAATAPAPFQPKIPIEEEEEPDMRPSGGKTQDLFKQMNDILYNCAPFHYRVTRRRLFSMIISELQLHNKFLHLSFTLAWYTTARASVSCTLHGISSEAESSWPSALGQRLPLTPLTSTMWRFWRLFASAWRSSAAILAVHRRAMHKLRVHWGSIGPKLLGSLETTQTHCVNTVNTCEHPRPKKSTCNSCCRREGFTQAAADCFDFPFGFWQKTCTKEGVACGVGAFETSHLFWANLLPPR